MPWSLTLLIHLQFNPRGVREHPCILRAYEVHQSEKAQNQGRTKLKSHKRQPKQGIVVVQNRKCSPLGSPYKSVCWETVQKVRSNKAGSNQIKGRVHVQLAFWKVNTSSKWETGGLHFGHLKQGLHIQAGPLPVLYPSHPLISQIHPNQPEIDPKTNSRQYAANNTKCCR